MAKSECVWFRNKSTGYVDGVERGSAAHIRMKTESREDEEGIPHMVWEEISAPQLGETKYDAAGMQANVQVPGAGLEEAAPEQPAEPKQGPPSGPPSAPPSAPPKAEK